MVVCLNFSLSFPLFLLFPRANEGMMGGGGAAGGDQTCEKPFSFKKKKTLSTSLLSSLRMACCNKGRIFRSHGRMERRRSNSQTSEEEEKHIHAWKEACLPVRRSPPRMYEYVDENGREKKGMGRRDVSRVECVVCPLRSPPSFLEIKTRKGGTTLTWENTLPT